MGKRELVLIAVFLVAGICVYQFTAPPPPPGSDVSVGGIFQRMRRTVQGAREQATAEAKRTVPVDPGITQLRVNLPRPCDLTITGSDESGITIATRTVARGFTQEEAKAAAQANAVKIERAGDAMVVAGVWNTGRRGGGGDPFIIQATITLSVPRGMSVRLEPHLGMLTVSDVAAVEAVASRGDTRLARIPGDIVLTHTSGTLDVAGGATLKLTSRNSRGEVSKIAGATRLDLTGARLKVSDVTGPLEIESRNSDLALDQLAGLKGTLRYNGQNGELRVDGLRVEARIDGRNTDIDVKLDGAAPVTIYNLGSISVTGPPGGYTLDAVASEGRVTVEESGITPSEGPDSRASGKVRGGGPTLTVRTTRGGITVRKAARK